MASPILIFTILSKSPAHVLRSLSILTFPPAFLLLLIHGIASSRVNPAIGLIPLAASSAFSAFLLHNQKACNCQSSGLTGSPMHLVADSLLGAGLLVVLITTWVNLPRSWDGGLVMLGTYGTNFLLVNFFIHLYFILQTLTESLANSSNWPKSCPHCQYAPFGGNSRSGRGKDYAPLLSGEEQHEYRDYQAEDDGARPEGDSRLGAQRNGDALV